MPDASNAVIHLEQGATLVPYAAMTDSGDHQIFTAADDIFSGKAGQAPVVRPNGIVSGRDLLSPHADNDKLSYAAFTAYVGGALVAVNAGTVSVVRGVGDGYIVNSIVVDDQGNVTAVQGTEADAFSETRAAAGGPALIAVDKVEIGQARLSSTVAAAVAAAEIQQVVGQHVERFDFPTWEIDNVGQGKSAAVAAQTNAHVKFKSALPLIHTGTIAKAVFIQYYEPIFAEESETMDFTAVEKSHSVQSTQYYGGAKASTSESLGQGGFTALLTNAVTDGLVADKNQILTVKYFPDRDQAPYILTQGKIGLARQWPVSGQIQAAVTISAERESAEFSS